MSSHQDVNDLLDQAQQAINSRNAVKAELSFRSILEIDPDHPQANLELAGLCLATDRSDEAVGHYQKVLVADPENQTALYNLGAIHFGDGDLDSAETMFERLHKQLPDNAKILNNLGNVAFEQSKFEKAVEYYQAALQADPTWWEAASNLASALDMSGQTEAALTAWSQALLLGPDEPVLLIDAANAYFSHGDTAKAAEILALYREPGNRTLDSELLHGRILVEQEQYKEAEAHYIAIIEAAPDAAVARIDLGHAYASAKQYKKSFKAYEDALKHGANELLVVQNLGKAYLMQGSADKALVQFERAYVLEPGNIVHDLNIANALYYSGDHRAALTRYETIIDKSPGNVEAMLNLATVHQMEDDHAAALALARKATEFDPENLLALEIMASALIEEGNLKEARKAALKISKIDPEAPEGSIISAAISQADGQLEEALETLDRGLKFAPFNRKLLKQAFSIHAFLGHTQEVMETGQLCIEHYPAEIQLETKLVNTILSCCEWQMYDKYANHLVAAVEDRIANNQEVAICLSNLQTLPVDYDLLVRAGRNVSESILRRTEHDPDRVDLDIGPDRYAGGGKTRIGYILPYVLFHSMPLQMKDLADRHDRSRFEVYGYCVQEPFDSDFARGLMDSFDCFRWSESPTELAAMINSDHIGVLIDNSGHTDISCLDVCALRPAPVNIHYIGYSLSCGADFIDYIITDPQIIPDEHKDVGPEKMFYIEDSMAPSSREPINDHVPTRTELGLPENGVVFSNFNQPFKIDSQIFDVWLEILKAVPGSVLWLGEWHERVVQNLRNYAEEHGVAGERIVFAEIIDHASHLARLSRSDLCIDTFHHGGGQTNLDSLWAGLPFISARGKTPGSRFGGFMLRAHGLSDLIVENLDDYRDLAIRLANDPDELAGLHERCRANRDSEPLFDREKMMKNLEQGYQAVWQRFLSGEEPEHLHINSENVWFEDRSDQPIKN
jgi:protein O-GlcNAc transferase